VCVVCVCVCVCVCVRACAHACVLRLGVSILCQLCVGCVSVVCQLCVEGRGGARLAGGLVDNGFGGSAA